MVNEYQLRILPEQAASEQSLKTYISREKGLDIRTINAVRVLKKEYRRTSAYHICKCKGTGVHQRSAGHTGIYSYRIQKR